jgi:sulfur carrier protein ThiS
MIVSEKLSYLDVLAALDLEEASIGRQVNPSIYRRVEFEKRASEEGGFLSRVREGPKLFLIGAEVDIAKPRKARARG